MPKISLPGSYKFRRVFSIVVLDDVNDGGTPYMGISPGRTRPCTHRPEREREQPINTLQSAGWQHGTRSGRMSLKKCVLVVRKDNLVQLPKRIHRYVNSGYSLFFRGSNGVSQVFC